MTSNSQKWRIIEIWIPLGLILTLFCLGLIYLLDVRMLDWRMALDEVDAIYTLNAFGELVVKRDFISPRHQYFGYGMLFYYLSYIAFWIRNQIQGAKEIIDLYMSMRWICFLSSVASLAAFFLLRWTAKLPRWFPYFAIFFTLTEWNFYYFSLCPKPENLQLFFIILTVIFIYQCRNQGGMKNLLCASIAAGLASASKMGGVFFLPVIILSDALNLIEHHKSKKIRRHIWARLLKRALLVIAVASGIYLILNLRWVFDFEYNAGFFKKAGESWETLGSEKWSGIWWIKIVAFGYFTFFAFLYASLKHIHIIVAKPFKLSEIDGDFLLNGLAIFFVIFLCLVVHDFQVTRYMMPIVPCFIVLSARTINDMFEGLKQRISSRSGRLIIQCLFLLLVLGADFNRIKPTWNTVQADQNYMESTRTQVGIYLLKHYPKNTKILYYAYAWVPGFYENAIWFNWAAPAPHDIQKMDPDLIFVIDQWDRSEKKLTRIQNHIRLIENLEHEDVPFHLAVSIPEKTNPKVRYMIYERNDLKSRLQKR